MIKIMYINERQHSFEVEQGCNTDSKNKNMWGGTNLWIHIKPSSFIEQTSSSCFNSCVRGAFTLVNLLGSKVTFSKTQKAFPPSGGAFGRPEREVLVPLIVVVIMHKELFPESGGGPLGILEGQQPSFEKKLISTHHWVVGHRKLEVWGHCRSLWSAGAAVFLLCGLLSIHKVVRERNSGTHWSAVMMVMATLVLRVVHL